MPLQEILQLRARIVLFLDGVADVGAVEAGDEGVALGDCEVRQDFRTRRLVGGRRQRHPRRSGKAGHHRVELPIGRAKIVPPLRQAVRLVDGDQRQASARVEPLQHILPSSVSGAT